MKKNELTERRCNVRVVALMLVALMMTGAVSCTRDRGNAQLREFLAGQMGREVHLPDDSACHLFDRGYGLTTLGGDYLIVSYISSDDCTACHLKLPFWKALAQRLDTLTRATANLVLVIRPDTLDKVTSFLEKANYDYPIIIDTLGRFTAMNDLPGDGFFHTVLLDADRRIVGLGNPVLEPQIEQFYMNQIAGCGSDNKRDEAISAGLTVKDLGVIAPGTDYDLLFIVTNHTDTVIPLDRAIASCDCVDVAASDLQPGAANEVRVRYRPADASGATHIPIELRYSGIDRPVVLHLYGYVE